MTAVDIQFSPATMSWPELRRAVLVAEERGFAACHVLDHLAGLPLGGTTMLESFALLGALTEITSLPLGTMVANVVNRQPGTLVTAAASIAIMSGRPFLFGIGAGSSPTSAWAAEQHATGAVLAEAMADRHARVEQVIQLARAEWSPDRDDRFATFPLPSPPPTVIVGVNSVALSELAGRSADGVTVPWRHPRRDEFLAAAERSVGDRPFLRVAYTTYDPRLLDPDHPSRREMDDRRIDRVVLAVLDGDF